MEAKTSVLYVPLVFTIIPDKSYLYVILWVFERYSIRVSYFHLLLFLVWCILPFLFVLLLNFLF